MTISFWRLLITAVLAYYLSGCDGGGLFGPSRPAPAPPPPPPVVTKPLPPPWDKEPLNSPRVKRAFLNFVLRAIENMRPDYLAIGVESNMLLSRDQSKWRQLKELHRDTYMAVKKVHRSLPVFFTAEVL